MSIRMNHVAEKKKEILGERFRTCFKIRRGVDGDAEVGSCGYPDLLGCMSMGMRMRISVRNDEHEDGLCECKMKKYLYRERDFISIQDVLQGLPGVAEMCVEMPRWGNVGMRRYWDENENTDGNHAGDTAEHEVCVKKRSLRRKGKGRRKWYLG